MDRLILILDVLILTLFWLLSLVAITPAHNLLVLYSESSLDLPFLTHQAIAARFMVGSIPFACAIITVPFGQWLAAQSEHTRVIGLIAHAMSTILFGLILLFTYALAGILPFLKIGLVSL